MTDQQLLRPPCEICQGPVLRGGKENRAHWLKRPTCGPVCGQKYQRRSAHAKMAEAVRDHPPCRCGRPILPKKEESVSSYNSRISCSLRCSREAQWAKRREKRPIPKPAPALNGAPQTVEEYLANGGVIVRCPVAYAAPSVHGALPEAEERRRIRRLKPPPQRGHWPTNYLFARRTR